MATTGVRLGNEAAARLRPRGHTGQEKSWLESSAAPPGRAGRHVKARLLESSVLHTHIRLRHGHLAEKQATGMRFTRDHACHACPQTRTAGRVESASAHRLGG
jgi:hypothetical protein